MGVYICRFLFFLSCGIVLGMAKTKTLFVCSGCGATYPGWQGQCDSCQEWNAICEEELVSGTDVVGLEKGGTRVLKTAVPICEVEVKGEEKEGSGISELDRVLGGGFVKGAVVLLGGEPGIGKSTLGLQVAISGSVQGKTVLYVSAEESESQVVLRARRLGTGTEELLVLSETHMGRVLAAVAEIRPDIVILDSIQMVADSELGASSGTVSQVRHCAARFVGLVKEIGAAGVIIGHVTKDGALAGPKVVEHMVDVILYFEGERDHQYRLLRCFKNRYAASDEMGIFEMGVAGLMSVEAPEGLFLGEGLSGVFGTVVCPVVEGNRVMVVELQALVVGSGYGMAKRAFVGVDSNRANLVIAALEKLMGIPLGKHDVFLNVVGGLKVGEPAFDLAMAMAILSSFYQKPLRVPVGVFGEVGLNGEIRRVKHSEKRVKAVLQLGIGGCLVPKGHEKVLKEGFAEKLVFVGNLGEAGRFLGE